MCWQASIDTSAVLQELVHFAVGGDDATGDAAWFWPPSQIPVHFIRIFEKIVLRGNFLLKSMDTKKRAMPWFLRSLPL